ncbi:MFS transporter [Pontivivens insulae]|uniref:Putative symporter YjmB n=1 Tax=Pontivivens insulae TaxID=1639689 RepID=A0A2R8ACT8_9RHOB|nr:MFS transporter [Pontivivens insulae]RED13987.1 Na+/melibiose symporter-like transporter [Pontivivens insulae]SPF30061.1 putative symporter YjmB [Pontivivens insulae]
MTVSRATLAAYAVPALPLAAIYLPVYVFLAPFWSGTMGLSVGAIGAVFIAVRLFDAVSDPMMGWLSDRIPLRGLRRKPWLVLALPGVALSIWALLAPPEGAGLGWFAGFMVTLTVFWTMYLTPYFSWGAELTDDYAERTRVTVWRETVGLVGTVVAMVAYGTADAETGLARVALFVVIGLPILTLYAVWRAPERTTGPSTPGAQTLLQVFREEPVFARLMLAYFLNGAANALPATLFLFFVEFRLGDAEAGGPLLILYFGAAVLGAPFWIWAGKRFEKHRIWCVAMIYAAIIFAFAFTLGLGDVAAFAVIAGLSGLALGADLSLPAAMQADVVDLDTARTGTARTGAFFALWSVATKASVAITGGVALLWLEAVGFSGQGGNAEDALIWLAALYALAPVVLKLMAVALMWGFPLTRAKQAEVRARIG